MRIVIPKLTIYGAPCEVEVLIHDDHAHVVVTLEDGEVGGEVGLGARELSELYAPVRKVVELALGDRLRERVYERKRPLDLHVVARGDRRSDDHRPSSG